ncbi:MFS transporter, partial [Streptomyces diastaticus]
MGPDALGEHAVRRTRPLGGPRSGRLARRARRAGRPGDRRRTRPHRRRHRDRRPHRPRGRMTTGTGLRPATSSLREVTGLPPYLRLLAGTQFAFNTGFYAVLPYLATHLGDGLGMAGWLVGLVLGLRTFSQQGLFVVGGALTDRYGPRPVVLAGCVLRIAGFAWLAFAATTVTVVAAVLLIGFAAALFSPAVESETAREAVHREQADGTARARTLAVFSAAGQAGAFLGPLLGSLLL